MKQTVMFAELMLHHRLGLIFCSEQQRAPESCLKQASLWHHKNALLSLLQKQNLLFIQPPGAPPQGCCALFSRLRDPKLPLQQRSDWISWLEAEPQKASFLLSFSHAFSFPHDSLKMIWAADQRAALTPVFSFPGKQRMLFNHVFVLLRKKKQKKTKKAKRPSAYTHKVFLGENMWPFFPSSIFSPPILWTTLPPKKKAPLIVSF